MKVLTNLDKSQVAELYKQMVLIRRFEEQSGRLYMEGKIKGFVHLYIGEEAIAVGAMSSLREDDYVVTHYRDHGHALARGLDPKRIMAELMGKATGCSGGKGGSMHLYDVSKRFMGGYAIVGGQMPVAVGLALAIKYQNQDRIAICFFGDGAVQQGEFHESLNLASLWNLPILFFLENNFYGMGTPVERTRAAGKDIYLAADAYNIPAMQIDGMDLIAVREATSEAAQRVRSGNGPFFLEAMTYRFRGHSMADPSTYRDSSEVNDWQTKDPINAFRELSLVEGLLNEKDITQIEEQVDAMLVEIVSFGEESEEPSLESLHQNVYAG